MRIVCDNCGAKYQISDEKVRNKVFKIRCKKCSHVIIVRADQQPVEAQPAAAPSDEKTRVVQYSGHDHESEAPEAQPPADAIWYTVINREQVGPLTREQIEAHFHAGDVDAETFVWAEGMADWTRLGAVAEFSLLVAPPPEPTADVGGNMFPDEPAAADTADAGGQQDEDEDLMMSNHAAASATAGSESIFGDDPAESPRVSASSLRNQRNENSVLFSLDALAADVDMSGAGISSAGITEGSGLIDISALAGPAAATDSAAGAFGGESFAPVSMAAGAGAPMPSMVRPPSGGSKVGLIVGALVVVGLAVGGTLFFLKKEQPVAKTPVTPVVQSPAAAAPKPAAAKPTAAPTAAAPTAAAPTAAAPTAAAPTAAAPTAAAPTAAAPAVAAPAAAKPAVAAKPKARRPRKARRPAKRSNAGSTEDAPVAAAPARRPTPAARPAKRARRKPAKRDEVDDLLGALDGAGTPPPGRGPAVPVAADPMLPAKLGRSDILRVVKKGARSIQTCKSQDPGVSGTIKINMKIAGTGRVSSATVKTDRFKGTPVGNCVAGKVRAFRFPQFREGPMTINMPFSL